MTDVALPREGDRPLVVLLYIDADRPLALRLHERLQRAGHQPWCAARDLLPGDDWVDGMPAAIARAAVVLVLITPRWPSSGRPGLDYYGPEDIAFAIECSRHTQPKIAVVPVLFDGLALDRLPYGLRRKVPIDASSRDFTPIVAGLARLLGHVEGDNDPTTPLPRDPTVPLPRDPTVPLPEDYTTEVVLPGPLAVDDSTTLTTTIASGGVVVCAATPLRPALVCVPAGEFTRGSPAHEAERRHNEGPAHRVRLTRAVWMAATPVTEGQFWRVRPGEDTLREVRELPISRVSWEAAIAYCNALSDAEGLQRVYLAGERRKANGYRLPTEAEWEYACRAGSTTRFWAGDDARDLARVGWYRANSHSTLHPVGELLSNLWGLFDMHGNCSEWCHDWYGSYPPEAQVDPWGPPRGNARVVRGGSAWSTARGARSAFRAAAQQHTASGSIGFRVVRDAPWGG